MDKRGPTLPALEGMLLLEQPLLHAPYDELRRHLRSHQRLSEHEFRHCRHSLAPLRPSKHKTPGPTPSAPKHQRRFPPGHPDSRTTTAATTPAPADVSTDVSMSVDEPDDSDVNISLNPREAAAAAAEQRLLTARAAEATVQALGNPKLTQEAQAAAEALTSVRTTLTRLRDLRNKLGTLGDKICFTVDVAQARTDHLADLHEILANAPTSNFVLVPALPTTPGKTSDAARPPAVAEGIASDGSEFEKWTSLRLDRMLVDYLLRQHWPRTASLLARTHHLEKLVDTDLFKEIAAVEETMVYVPPSKAVGSSNGRLELGQDDQTSPSPTRPTCTAALAWCTENKAALKKARSTLEFELRLQEFIELVRVRSSASLKQAVQYARKHLAVYTIPADVPGDEVDTETEEHLRATVYRALGFLACASTSCVDLYHDLATPERWAQLRQKFHDTALDIHSFPAQPMLHLALSAGLSALKLPDCYRSGDASGENVGAAETLKSEFITGDSTINTAFLTSAQVTNPTLRPPADPAAGEERYRRHKLLGNGKKNCDCPICAHDRLGALAKEVPWSHHVNSTLICRVTGQTMNDDDPPLVLPNGQVYSASGLAELERASDIRGQLVDPATGQTFALSRARKMFVS